MSRVVVVRHALIALVAFIVCGAPLAMAQTPTGSPNASVCIYNDRTFSTGAAICPQPKFMLMCSQENDKPTWKVVNDVSLSNRCLAPSLTANAPGRKRYGRRASQVRTTAVAPATPASARCFVFNNKRYCE